MMVLEKCPTHEELRALSLGQLSEERSDEMLGHLHGCETCQAELATADPQDDTLVGHLRNADTDEEYTDEAECQIAMAKALGSLAAANTQSIDDSELSNLLPKVLGEYEIVRPIGRGGMGNVYLARHSKLGRQVALKVLSSHRLMQPRMRQRFETEMRAVGQLSHPNIVTAHDAREVDELALLVTEYIDGLDVGQILRRTGKLSVANACEIARQTALALEYVKDQGLVHRDIKPSNVMIGKAGEVKLLDLGLARLQLGDDDRPEMTATGQAMGTADYIAPEQVSDSRNVDIRADIYALGCTLFKMLTGQPPFDDDRYPTVFAKMTAHVSDAPGSLESLEPEVPAELAKLVHRMIAKDVKDRPQTPAEVAEILARFSSWAELKRLVEQAVDAGEIAGQPPRKPGTTPLMLQHEPQPFIFRRVPLAAAIAAGLVGILIGYSLGIIITIKHSDGTTTQVEVPKGANAKISEKGDVEIELAGGDANSKVAANGQVIDFESDYDRLQGVWRSVKGRTVGSMSGSMVIGFSDDNYITIFNGNASVLMKFGMTKKDKFSTLTFKGFDDVTMQAVIQFNGNDELTMRTEQGSVSLERIANLPITPDELKKIEENPETLLLSKSVKMIAEFNQTGEFPLSKDMLSAQEAAMQAQSRNNLKQIAIGLHNYHDAYQTFPAATMHERGSEKTKPYSWRVAILPLMNEQALYDQYKFDEEWDSENNLKVLNQMPKFYRLPTSNSSSSFSKKDGDIDESRAADKNPTETPYLAIVGPETVISDKPVKMRDIKDGTSNTIMVVETKKMVPWTKPEDIAYSADAELPAFEPIYSGGFNAAKADGAIELIGTDLDESALRALITRDGREPIGKR